MKLSAKAIEKQIRQKRGNISAVAKTFGVSRTAIYKRIESSETLKKAITEARDTMLDNVERTLYDQAVDGNMTAVIFMLKTQGKKRGYVERQEIQHSGDADNPIVITKMDVDAL